MDTALLESIAKQMMSSNTVIVDEKPIPVSRTSKHRLRTLPFTMDGRECLANSSECDDCLTVVSRALQAGRKPCF